jgi:hypothetical protein
MWVNVTSHDHYSLTAVSNNTIQQKQISNYDNLDFRDLSVYSVFSALLTANLALT